MTAAALACIDRRTLLQQAPVSNADLRGSLEVTDIRRHIGNRLRGRQIVAVRNALHAQIQAPIVTIIDELLAQNGCMLTCDAWYLTVGSATAVATVTHRAGPEDLGAPIETRRTPLDRVEFLLG